MKKLRSIIVRDYREKKCLLIDVSMQKDDNVSRRIGKFSNYKDLEIEVIQINSLKQK